MEVRTLLVSASTGDYWQRHEEVVRWQHLCQIGIVILKQTS